MLKLKPCFFPTFFQNNSENRIIKRFKILKVRENNEIY